MADNTDPKPGATPEIPQTPEVPAEETFPDGLGDKGKEALKRERDARKIADKARTDAETELSTLRKEKADAETERARLAEEEATKKGEFEKLANDRAEKLTAATAELKARDDKIASYEAALKPLVDAQKTAIEKDGKEWLDGFPADAEPLVQIGWLTDRAAFKAKVSPADPTRPRVPITPRPNGDGPTGVEDDKRALRRSGMYDM